MRHAKPTVPKEPHPQINSLGPPGYGSVAGLAQNLPFQFVSFIASLARFVLTKQEVA